MGVGALQGEDAAQVQATGGKGTTGHGLGAYTVGCPGVPQAVRVLRQHQLRGDGERAATAKEKRLRLSGGGGRHVGSGGHPLDCLQTELRVAAAVALLQIPLHEVFRASAVASRSLLLLLPVLEAVYSRYLTRPLRLCCRLRSPHRTAARCAG